MSARPTPSQATEASLRELAEEIRRQEATLREGGGAAGIERQRRLGRLTARERLARLLDPDSGFLELGLWAGHGMYDQWGGLPAAGVVTGIGTVAGRAVMAIANDATVKAGAMFPQSIKKVLRAQRVAFECRLPTIYLVDSSGVFLPLQDEIFPDEDDFGRIFRNNSIFSAAGIPQFAAVMGNCIAGGAYLPVLCDQLLMTEGSGLYLAGPALVKAAIGQVADPEELGGARMHAEMSGTVDFVEPDDPACLGRLRRLVALLPEDPPETRRKATDAGAKTAKDPERLYDLVSADGRKEYDLRDVLACIVDDGSVDEYRPGYGQTLVTCYARIAGRRGDRDRGRHLHGKRRQGRALCHGLQSVACSDRLPAGRARVHGRTRSRAVRDHPFGRQARQRRKQQRRSQDHAGSRQLFWGRELRALRESV